jgi:hypothetical protein
MGKENVGTTVLTYRLIGRDDKAQKLLHERQPTWGVHHERWEHPWDTAT